MAILLALVCAAAYGGGDFAGGLASRRDPPGHVALIGGLASVVLLAFGALFVSADGLTSADLAWGAAAGLLGGVGVLFLYLGLARGLMSVVSPVTAVCSALVPLVAGLAQGEEPGWLALAGVLVGLLAIAIVSTAPAAAAEWSTRRSVSAGLVAGIGFGGFFTLLAEAGDDSGLWPIVASRSAGVVLYIVAVLVTPAWHGRVRIVPLALVAGVLDSVANLAYLLAVRRGLLSLVAVVSSLYPAGTVLLARLVTGEEIGRRRVAGLALALAAVALVATG